MVRATVNQGQITAWTAHAIPGGIGGQTPQLAVNPINADVLMAVFAGYSGQNLPSRHVFLSSNGGTGWTDISGAQSGNSVPDMPLYDAVFDPNSEPHALIVASDLGVMRSRNNGNTWQVLGLGFPNVHATSLAIDATVNPSLLKAGTFGRSAWQLVLNKAVQTCIDRDAGPLWNNADAQNKCPSVCAGHSETWLGQWTTTVWGVQSVCGCCSGG